MKGSDDRHGHVRLDMIHPWFLILHAKQPCEKLKPIMSYTMAFQLNLVVSMLCHSDRKKKQHCSLGRRNTFPFGRISGLRRVNRTIRYRRKKAARHGKPSCSVFTSMEHSLDVYPTFKFLVKLCQTHICPLHWVDRCPLRLQSLSLRNVWGSFCQKPPAILVLERCKQTVVMEIIGPFERLMLQHILLKWLWCIFFFLCSSLFFATFDFGTLLQMFVSQDDFDVELTWRVAVVGSTATGKSSLVRRFCGRSPNLKQLGESGGRESE